MQINYQYFVKEQLFAQKYKGLFSFEKYMNYARFIGQNFNDKTISKVIIDFRDLKFSDSEDVRYEDLRDQINKVANIRRAILHKDLQNKNTKHVIWVDKPLPTVIAQLFISNFQHLSYQYCTTTAVVKNILELDSSFDLNLLMTVLENSYELKVH